MKDILDKLLSLEHKISNEKGSFNLFAIFLREDSEDKWDLVVSAPWLVPNRKESFNYIVNQIKSVLDNNELMFISRIVLLEEGNPVLNAINRALEIEHGRAEVKDSNFFGLQIKHAYIITSRKEKPIPKTKTA
jgi:hypothetical protein